MRRKLLFLLCIPVLSLMPAHLFAQAPIGTLNGKVTDKVTGIYLGYANIILMQKGRPVAARLAEPNGSFKIDSLPSGKYEIKINYKGYESQLIKEVVIAPKKNTYIQIPLVAPGRRKPVLVV